jgi:AraC-like DNA-binding protein
VADFYMFYFSKVLNMNIQSLQILPLNITIFTFIIIYFGKNQTVIYEHKTDLAESITKETESADNITIDRTLMEEKQIEELTDTILQYLNEKKPFLNPDYSLQMMVEDLKISRQKLSYLINIGQQKNFLKLINDYRVREVKGKLLDPGYNHYSVLGIGLECGFNSKTSFNRIFKEETGYTPSALKKNHC